MPIVSFLVAVAYVPGVPSAATAGRWWAAAVGVSVLLLRTPTRPGTGHRLGAALLTWAALSTALWSVSGWDALGGMLQLLVGAGVFLVAAEAGLEATRRAWLWFALGVSMSAPVALLQVSGWSPVIALQPGVGLFLAPNMAGEAGALALIGALGMRGDSLRLWRLRAPAWALAVGPATLLLTTGGRAPVAMLAAAGAAALWLGRPDWRASLAALYLGGAALLTAAWADGLLGHAGRLSDRLEIWSRYGLAINPWGDGLGAAAVAMTGYEHAHSEFIEFAFELGIGSVLMWGVLLHALGARPVLERAALAACAAQCLVWFPLHDPATFFMVAVLAGALCGERLRVRVARCPCGVDRASCLHDRHAHGTGEIRHAALRREHVAARQESSLGGGQLRRYLRAHSGEASCA